MNIEKHRVRIYLDGGHAAQSKDQLKLHLQVFVAGGWLKLVVLSVSDGFLV